MHARCIERRLHMNIHTYIDYIDDPNDTYEQYLERKQKSIISAVSLRRLTLMMKPLLI